MTLSVRTSMMALALAGSAAQAAEQEAYQSPATETIQKYDETVGELSSHVAERYAEFRKDRRRWLLSDPVDRYAFHLANMELISIDSAAKAKGDLSGILAVDTWPTRSAKRFGDVEPDKDPILTFSQKAGDRAMARFLCEPAAEKSAAEARFAPLAAAGGKLKVAAQPSGRSGISLFFHALTADYGVGTEPIADAKSDEVYFATLAQCVGDLKEARAPYMDLDPRTGQSEAFIESFGAGLAAVNGLFNALNAAFDGLGRMIEGRKIEAAIQEYVRALEPFPNFQSRDKAVERNLAKIRDQNLRENEARRQRNIAAMEEYRKQAAEYENRAGESDRGAPPSPPELEALMVNSVRTSIGGISDDLRQLTKAQRVRAARAFYAEFLNYQDTLAMIKPGKMIDIVDVDGKRAVVLRALDEDVKDVALTKAAMTSSARHGKIVEHLAAIGMEERKTALLEAAEAYDLANDASGVSASVIALSGAWGKMVRYAYEPKSDGIGSALALLTEIQATMAGVKKAFKDFETEVDKIGEDEKKDDDDEKKDD